MTTHAEAINGASVSRATALKFVLLVGVLSFFADFTYEGSRAILGPYLVLLQVSATVVGIVTGLGELLGYGLRLVSGRMADITRKFWPITISATSSRCFRCRCWRWREAGTRQRC